MPKWPPNGKQTSIKKLFLVVSGNFTLKNGPNNLVRGLLLNLDIGPYIPPTYGALHTSLGPFGGAQMAPKLETKKRMKTCFLVASDYFS
jgi:hypothetical protein